MKSSTPLEVIEAARRGGQSEIERLIELIWPDAYRLAYGVLGERQSAEDVAQESCIVLYREIASLRTADAFRVWLYRIVMRRATAFKKRRDRAEAVIGNSDVNNDRTTTIDIWRALASLSPNLRNVVVLHYFEDLPSREIASILRIPEGTVRFRLMTARRRLRPLLDDIPQPSAASHEVHHAI